MHNEIPRPGFQTHFTHGSNVVELFFRRSKLLII